MLISLEAAITTLQRGGLIAFPTETVYGLGALANNAEAVEKIYAVKERPKDNPLICHFYSLEHIESYGITVDVVSRVLFQYLTPGPLSILLPLPKQSPLYPATRGRETILCRVPDHPMALSLLLGVEVPIAAPSANKSGTMSGTIAQMVDETIGSEIDGVVDGGLCTIGIESTIVSVGNETVTILRPGSIGIQEIREVLDRVGSSYSVLYAEGVEHPVPGTRYRHYAPCTPLLLMKNAWEVDKKKKCVVLGTEEGLEETVFGDNELRGVAHCLGTRKRLTDVAKNLYHLLYQLDKKGLDCIYLVDEQYGTSALGIALQNRIERMISGG